MPDDFKQIGEVFNEDAFNKIREVVSQSEVVEKFEKIFPEFKKIAIAKKVRNGILFLRVENAVWRSELHLNKSLMIEKINAHFDKKVVNNIKFI